jgi:hypothetical protein
MSLLEAINFDYQSLKVKPAELEGRAGFWSAGGRVGLMVEDEDDRTVHPGDLAVLPARSI